MNNKQIALTIITMALGIVMLMNTVSAANPNLGIFKQNSNVELLQTCFASGVICDSCQISSVKYPDSTIASSNLNMTKRTGDFNYSFANTQTIGRYNVNGYCNAGGLIKPFVYNFDITSTGDSGDTNITEFAFILGIAILIILFVYVKVSKLLGSIGIMLVGFGMLFRNPINGWIGWIIIGAGLLATLYTLMGGNGSYRRRRY